MSHPLPHKIAKQRVLETYKQARHTKMAADAAGVPLATAERWLVDAGLKQPSTKATGLTQWDRAVTGPKAENLPRVDRDPCPRCNVRKDIGCKHFPKQPDPAPVPTDRERAEAMWSKQA